MSFFHVLLQIPFGASDTKALEGLRGTKSVEVKYLSGTRGTITFKYDPHVTSPHELKTAVEKYKKAYVVHIGKPEEVPLPSAEIDFKSISSGGPYEIESNLRKGKITIVEFYLDGQMESTNLGLALDTLSQKYPLAVRTVNLGNADGSDDAAKQLQKDFGVKEAPYVRIYGKDGKFIRDVKGNKPDEIENCLK